MIHGNQDQSRDAQRLPNLRTLPDLWSARAPDLAGLANVADLPDLPDLPVVAGSGPAVSLDAHDDKQQYGEAADDGGVRNPGRDLAPLGAHRAVQAKACDSRDRHRRHCLHH